MDRYTHQLADRTASALEEFSKGLLKISCLRPRKTCNVIVSYDDAPPETRHTEAMAFVELNEDGVYFFNEVEIGDLERTVQVYSMMCAEVIKSIAADEKREDYQKPKESEDEESDRKMPELLASVDIVHEPDGTEPDDDDEEIFEEYKFV